MTFTATIRYKILLLFNLSNIPVFYYRHAANLTLNLLFIPKLPSQVRRTSHTYIPHLTGPTREMQAVAFYMTFAVRQIIAER